jgi:hypothetical protein
LVSLMLQQWSGKHKDCKIKEMKFIYEGIIHFSQKIFIFMFVINNSGVLCCVTLTAVGLLVWMVEVFIL